jgi:CubicO group peptidase (beta-lactamase class C family)
MAHVLAAAILLGAFAQAPLDPEHLKAAAEHNAWAGGRSMLVMHEGKVVFEDYPNRGAKETPIDLASGAKGFTAALAVAAAMDGLLTLDEPVSKTLTDWQNDPQRSQTTLRDLLTLTSGIPGGEIGRVPTYEAATRTRAIFKPGFRFMYGPTPYQIFGEVMRRKLEPREESVERYLQRRVFEPIGMKVAVWRKDGDNVRLPSGMSLTAAEWAKYGQLIAQRGKWGDKQVLDAELLAQCFEGTPANSAHGIGFWLNRQIDPLQLLAIRQLRLGTDDMSVSPHIPKDLVLAAGLGKQRLYVSPDRNLVVVRQGPLSGGLRFSDRTFLNLLLTGKAE